MSNHSNTVSVGDKVNFLWKTSPMSVHYYKFEGIVKSRNKDRFYVECPENQFINRWVLIKDIKE